LSTFASMMEALLLGSGSTVRRMRAALVRHERLGPVVETADLTSLYRRITDVLGIESAALNIEGAAVLDGHLYLFSRGIPAAGLPSQSVVIELAAFMNAWPSPDRLGALNIDDGPVVDADNAVTTRRALVSEPQLVG
jgi:hypothetical protein